VGARFKSINRAVRGPNWWNKPVITTVDPNRELSFQRTEPFAGTILWRHRFAPVVDGDGPATRVSISYEVLHPVSIVGWFVIGTLYGRKDRRTDLRSSIETSLDRLAAMAERELVARERSER
jgi:hypothetical protein